MTAFALSGYQYPLLQRRNTGTSKCSDELDEIVQDTITHLKEPVTSHTRESLYVELTNIFLECSKVNWDQYGANPVSAKALMEAYWFVTILPSWIPNPEVTPEPSGEIGFEWNFGKNMVFVVTIKGNHSIAYAGMLGSGNRTRGIESYSEAIPSVIFESIRRISK
jgi:hypothetical protein